MLEKQRKKLKARFEDYINNMDSSDLNTVILQFKGYHYLLWFVPAGLWALNFLQLFIPRHNLNWGYLMWWLIGVAGLVLSFMVNRMLINLESRVVGEDGDENSRIDAIKDMKWKMDLQVILTMGSILCLPFTFTIIPYMQFLMDHPSFRGMHRAQVEAIAGSGLLNNIFWILPPVMITLYLLARTRNEERLHAPAMEKWMGRYEWHNRGLHNLLNGGKPSPHEPIMRLGISQETGDYVEQTVKTRLQNAVYFGPIGAGKTSTIFIPQIKRDIDYYLEYIRDYEKASKDPTWMQPHGAATHYLNGFSVIDTTNDLCREVYEYSMKLGVPKEKVIWLDPENEETPALNLLRGPVEKAAENVTNIISGLKGGQNDFFKQSERTHLKNFIYLLKLTAVMDGSIASFGDLMEMYGDIEIVWKKMQILDGYVNELKKLADETREQADANPNDTKLASKANELNDKYKVAWQTAQWFHKDIQPVTIAPNSQKPRTYSSGPHKGQPMHVDAQTEFVGGLINTLDDISKNIPLRRVLFRDSGTFNLDDYLYNGGILLCSTAKAAIGDQLAETLGQIYTMSLQAATLRREPNCPPIHPLYADEFPDYLSESFSAFASQARKYNVPIIIAAQSPAQLAYKYGPDYFNTLMSVMLTRGTFGDLGAEDAKQLEPLFGEHEETVESYNEQEIDVAADQDNNRRMITTRLETVPNISASDIMGMEKFTVAVRTPGQHSSDMFNRIRVQRITDQEVANDHYKFDVQDPDDSSAFLAMIANEVHDNPDFDEIDKQIMQIAQEKVAKEKAEASIQNEDANADASTTSANDVAGSNSNQNTNFFVDADNDLSKSLKDSQQGKLKKHHQSASKPANDQTTQSRNSTSPTSSSKLKEADELHPTSFGTGDGTFNLFDGDEGLGSKYVNVGGQKRLDKRQLKKSDTDEQAKANESKDTSTQDHSTQLKEIAADDQAISDENNDSPGSPVMDLHHAQVISAKIANLNGQHGGNHRLDNHTKEAAHPHPTQWVTGTRGPNITNRKQNVTEDAKEGEKVLYIDKNHQLVEDKKDRYIMEQELKDQRQAYLKKLKTQGLDKIRVQIEEIQHDKSLDEFDRLQELINLKNKSIQELQPIYPTDIQQVMSNLFDNVIQEQKQHTKQVSSVITAADNLASTERKATENGKKAALADDLQDMLNGMVDRPVTTPIDKDDPFYQQHGMDNSGDDD